MAQEPDIIRLKRGSATRWQVLNPVLLQGEPGYDVTTGVLKVGDGVTPWNDLQPVGFLVDIQTDLNVVGVPRFVILENDTDSSSIPDGTFIARLPA